jgi:regulator of replication initiation timing
MSYNELLKEYSRIKTELSRLQHEEGHIKDEIHSIVDNNNINKLRGNRLEITRSHRSRDAMIKKNIPRNIWEQYGTVIEYDTLTIRKI